MDHTISGFSVTCECNEEEINDDDDNDLPGLQCESVNVGAGNIPGLKIFVSDDDDDDACAGRSSTTKRCSHRGRTLKSWTAASHTLNPITAWRTINVASG